MKLINKKSLLISGTTYIHIQRDTRLDMGIDANNVIVPHHTHTYSFDLPYTSLNNLDGSSHRTPYNREPKYNP